MKVSLFLHEDGSIYTKLELNEDLANLIALFPELKTDKDKWTGHSFRAGLATVLALLGFSKAEIQSWGRWRSDAYLAYVMDQTHRRRVSAKLMTTFNDILSSI